MFISICPRQNLYEKRVDPDAMLECLQADLDSS